MPIYHGCDLVVGIGPLAECQKQAEVGSSSAALYLDFPVHFICWAAECNDTIVPVGGLI